MTTAGPPAQYAGEGSLLATALQAIHGNTHVASFSFPSPSNVFNPAVRNMMTKVNAQLQALMSEPALQLAFRFTYERHWHWGDKPAGGSMRWPSRGALGKPLLHVCLLARRHTA